MVLGVEPPDLSKRTLVATLDVFRRFSNVTTRGDHYLFDQVLFWRLVWGDWGPGGTGGSPTSGVLYSGNFGTLDVCGCCNCLVRARAGAKRPLCILGKRIWSSLCVAIVTWVVRNRNEAESRDGATREYG
jgi:hypothetical protein